MLLDNGLDLPPFFNGKCVLRFLGLTLVLSTLLVLATLFLFDFEYPLWKIARRCVILSACLSLFICVRYLDSLHLRMLGLSWNKESKRDFLFGILLGGTTLLIIGGMGLMVGFYEIHLHPNTHKRLTTLLTFIPAALAIGFSEELLFRGYLLHHLRRISVPFALLTLNFMYATTHLKDFHLSYPLLQELFGLFLFGMVLSYARLLTGNLWLGIALHAVLAYGARNSKLWLHFADPSLIWLWGTNRLVNGMMCWPVLILMGLMIGYREKVLKRALP